MASNPADGGAHLTTSRVNRLLRPLRNKCSGLAALPKTVAASRVTNLKQSATWDPDERPPLTVLYPSTGSKKLTLGGHSADEFELARRIHAVGDAFKNIAHVAFGQPYKGCSIPSLAIMCALVVGETIPCINSDSTSAEDSADETLDVDDIYEVVPPHYRRFLVISHALSMILSICAHHHTLLTILLDHCLSFGLVHESTRLLNIILTHAFLPSDKSHPPPIMHPGHTNYLLDLYVKWTAGNKSSGASPDSVFTTSAFCQAVLATLSASSFCDSYTLWNSKVLNKLFQVVEGCDTGSHISVIHTLCRYYKDTSSLSPNTENSNLVVLREKLSEMMSGLLDLLFTRHDQSFPQSRIHAVIDMLFDCRAAQLHYLRTSASSSAIDLPDVVIVFTTHIFVTFRNLIDNHGLLLAVLDESRPIPTTFSRMMVHFTQCQREQAFGDLAEEFLSKLKVYSSALCSEKLFRLDASLWACGLCHFEASIATTQNGDSTLVTKCRRELMEAVEVAERRCFGGETTDSPIVSSNYSARARRTHHVRMSEQWEWEEMVGSWIRKTPIHKKRKIDDGLPHTPRPGFTPTLGTISSTSLSTSPSIHHQHLSTLSSSSPCSHYTDVESQTEDGSEHQEEADKENHPSASLRVDKRSRCTRRHSSNFFTLLADARLNRIELHAKARSDPKVRPRVIPKKQVLSHSSQEPRHDPCKLERKTFTHYRKTFPPAVSSRIALSSDDSLNLFACATASSTRC